MLNTSTHWVSNTLHQLLHNSLRRFTSRHQPKKNTSIPILKPAQKKLLLIINPTPALPSQLNSMQ